MRVGVVSLLVAQKLLFIGDFTASVRDKTPPGTNLFLPFREGIIAMLDERFARLRTHRNNIARYQGLLKTDLTDLERQFIERRLSEEQSEFELLSADTFPLEFKVQNDPARSRSDEAG